MTNSEENRVKKQKTIGDNYRIWMDTPNAILEVPVPHSPPTPPKKKIKRLQKDYIDRIHAWAWLKGEQFDPDLLGDKINEIIDYINDYQSIYFPLNTHDK